MAKKTDRDGCVGGGKAGHLHTSALCPFQFLLPSQPFTQTFSLTFHPPDLLGENKKGKQTEASGLEEV